MDFLVEFDIQIPDDASRSEVEERQGGEAAAAASWRGRATWSGSGSGRWRLARARRWACTAPIARHSWMVCSALFRGLDPFSTTLGRFRS